VLVLANTRSPNPAPARSPVQSRNDFGIDIATLITLMEDHREQLAVLVTGYTDRMQ
jgi:hypothetical protein